MVFLFDGYSPLTYIDSMIAVLDLKDASDAIRSQITSTINNVATPMHSAYKSMAFYVMFKQWAKLNEIPDGVSVGYVNLEMEHNSDEPQTLEDIKMYMKWIYFAATNGIMPVQVQNA